MSYPKLNGAIIVAFGAIAQACALFDNWTGCAILCIGCFVMFALAILNYIDNN